MFFPKLSQIATRDVITVDDSLSIQEAVHIMHQHNIRDVIVNGELGLRILTARELIEFRVLNIPFSTSLKDTQLKIVPQLTPDHSVVDALALIKDLPDEHLCLVEDGELFGIVSYTDLASCLDPQHLAATKTIGEMVRLSRVLRVSPQDTIETTFLELNQLKQSAAIVVDLQSRPLGIITQSDIIKLLSQDWQGSQTVEQAMTSPLKTLPETMSMQEALTFSRTQRIKRLVVIDSQQRISGILHQKDLIALVYQDWSERLQHKKREIQAERDLFAGGPVTAIVWKAEPGWPIEFVSDNIQNLIGYRASDLTEPSFRFVDIIHPDDLKRWSKELSQFIAERRPSWEQHIRVIDQSGQVRWLYDYSRAEYNLQGGLAKLHGYLLDQTEQVQVQVALEKTQERLTSMVNQSHQIVWEVDATGLHTFISPAVTEVLGYQPQDLIGLVRCHDLYTPNNQTDPEKLQIIDLLRREVTVKNCEAQMLTQDGQEVWLSTTAQTLFDQQGRVTGYRGVSLDITEQKLAEQKIAENEERWRSVLDSTDQGVWDWNAQTNKVYFSDKWKSILDYQPEEIGDDVEEWTSRIHPDDKDQVLASIDAHIAGKTEFFETTHRLRAKGGHYKWILDRGRVLTFDLQGRPLRLVGTHADVTQKYQDRERLNRIAENIPGMIYQYVLHPDGTNSFPYVSQGVINVYGVTAEQVKQDADLIFKSIHPDDLPKLTKNIRLSAQNLTVWNDEHRVNLPGKGVIWVSGQSTPIKQDDGSIRWDGYIYDITERKQQEEKVENAEERFRLTMEATNTGLWTWNVQTGEVEWSDECYHQIGFDPAEFEPSFKNVVARQSEYTPEQISENVKQQMAEKQGYDLQLKLRHKDGHDVWIQSKGKVKQLDSENQPLLVMGTHIDISEQKSQEKQLKDRENALAEQREMYAGLVESHPYFINRYLPDTTMQYVNNEMASFLGTTPEAMIGRRWIENIPEEQREVDIGRLKMLTPSNPFDEYVNETIRPDGQENQVRWHTRAFFDEQSEVSFYQSVGIDITEQLAAEAKIKQAQQEAETANRAKSEFLANMSHEIRTPMSAILGFSELALQDELPTKARNQVSKILRAGRSLLGIINDILDFSKIESGRLSIQKQPFYFNALFDQLSSLFNDTAANKQIRLTWELDPQLAPVYNGDELRLRQILTNLIGNAVKFTDQGEVRLVVKQVDIDDHQAWLRFEIHDTGMGISDENRAILFQPFSQADTTITREHGGSGLGLVISQRLVLALGGEGIEVESQLGKGSCFSFTIAFGLSNKQLINELKQTHYQLSLGQQSLSGEVLLVEDNNINQEIAREMLMRMGLSVQTADDGVEAVEKVKSNHFDAVLMDIQMPKMDGYQATRAIREFNPQVPIIALTAAAMVEDREKALTAGMNAHLSKPIDSGLMYQVLNQWLEESDSQPIKADVTDSDLPELEGFNIEQGLALLQGNKSLYLRLLDRFSDQLKGQFSELPTLLRTLGSDQQDDQAWLQAQSLAHGLKGVAGNLSATKIAELATYIDQQLKQHKLIAMRTINTLEKAMVKTEAMLKMTLKTQIEQSETSSISPSVNLKKAAKRVKQLKASINQNEYIDPERLDELFNYLPTEFLQHKTVLQSALEQFDFKQAEQVMQVFDKVVE